MYLIKKKKKEKILQHGRFIFVSEPWNMKWYKPHFCYIYVLFQHYILYRFISFHFKFNLTGFSNSTGLPLFDTPIIHSKFQIYNFILEELKFIITKIKNWIIYIYIIFRIKLIKEFTKIILPLYFSLQHPLTRSRCNRSTLAVILLERNRIYTVQDWIRISMKWNDLARGIIRWTGIRKLSCIRLSMRTV